MKTITIWKKNIPIWFLILSIILILSAIATATYLIGQLKIGYKIEPTTPEAVTLNPNPVTLDLGTLPSGSTGKIDFGNCSRLSLSSGYEITFELDGTTLEDFDDFRVDIWIYVGGTTTSAGYVYLWKGYGEVSTETLDAGDYDIHIKIEYDAKHVTETKTGEVKISISY